MRSRPRSRPRSRRRSRTAAKGRSCIRRRGCDATPWPALRTRGWRRGRAREGRFRGVPPHQRSPPWTVSTCTRRAQGMRVRGFSTLCPPPPPHPPREREEGGLESSPLFSSTPLSSSAPPSSSTPPSSSAPRPTFPPLFPSFALYCSPAQLRRDGRPSTGLL